MSDRQAVALYIVGALILAAIITVILLRSRGDAPERPPDTPGQRLLAHSRDRNDYRLLVGVPPTQPTAWAEVARMDESSVTLRDSKVLSLSEVTAYLVAYPHGEMVVCRGPDTLPLPTWVRFREDSSTPDRDELTASDLKEGLSAARVTFGKSTSAPGSRRCYSTTLTNISGKRIRVLKFGGYRRAGSGFTLNTITRRFFTAEDFREWYGQKGDWIDPGQSVTDRNNYGKPPVLWAYYCQDEEGRKLLVGGILE